MAVKGGKHPKGRYRPWPKHYDGLRFVIDKDRLREEYLRNPHYSWEDFCAANTYKATWAAKKDFNIKAWQQEWLHQQVTASEDGLMNEALEVKKFIAKARLEFPKEWNDTAKAMKGLADSLLRKAMLNAKWDQENEAAILAGKAAPRSSMKTSELSSLADAMGKIQALQRNALLMPSQDVYKAAIPIRDADPVVVEAEQEESRLRSIEVALVGGGTLDDTKMTLILDKWIDQQAKAPPATGGEDLDDLDKPLESL